MSGWIIKRGAREVPIPDQATLEKWAEEGRFNPGDLIFHPVVQRWLYARDVLEISDAFTRVAPQGAQPMETTVAGASSSFASQHSGAVAAKLAANYRQLVLWVGVQLLISFGLLLDILPLFLGAALLTSVFALAMYAARTADALGSSAAPIWAIAMLIPFINIVTLLVLSSKATRVCRANGIAVGFLGPRLS